MCLILKETDKNRLDKINHSKMFPLSSPTPLFFLRIPFSEEALNKKTKKKLYTFFTYQTSGY